MTNTAAGVGPEHVPLWRPSPGTDRALQVYRFGNRGARPKAYLQASLHADEIPGMLVLSRLARRLQQAQRRGEVRGEIAVVPAANPIGLSQFVLGRSVGRFGLDGSGNFNRHFPDLSAPVAARVAARLGRDADANVEIIRAAALAALADLECESEADFLRVSLMRLAVDADIVLDLHCDAEAVLHVYTGTPLWPDASDLSAQLGSRATLLATCSGGNPFDEAVAGLWWALDDRFPSVPVPPACLAATVELRGEADVSEALAEQDAGNLFRFLQRRRLIAGDPGPLPAPLCEATPLAGVDMVKAPAAGILCFEKQPGEAVAAGEIVASVVDPLGGDRAAARCALRASTGGILFGRSAERFARPGQIVCKVAGRDALPGRASGHLLTP